MHLISKRLQLSLLIIIIRSCALLSENSILQLLLVFSPNQAKNTIVLSHSDILISLLYWTCHATQSFHSRKLTPGRRPGLKADRLRTCHCQYWTHWSLASAPFFFSLHQYSGEFFMILPKRLLVGRNWRCEILMNTLSSELEIHWAKKNYYTFSWVCSDVFPLFLVNNFWNVL